MSNLVVLGVCILQTRDVFGLFPAGGVEEDFSCCFTLLPLCTVNCARSLVGASLTTVSSMLNLDDRRHVGGACLPKIKGLHRCCCGRDNECGEACPH